MADEIKTTVSIVYSNTSAGGLSRTIAPGTINIDQTTIGFYGKVQLVPSAGSTTLKALDDVITADGVLYMKNLDATNFVTYGSSLLEFKLKAGEVALQRVKNGATVQILADTANVKVDTVVFED